MKGAKGLIINITGGQDLTLYEVDEAANRIREEVDSEANIIFGMTTDPKMENEIKLTIISTGFPTTETLIQRDIEKTVGGEQMASRRISR